MFTLIGFEVIFCMRILGERKKSTGSGFLLNFGDDIGHNGLGFRRAKCSGDKVVLHVNDNENFIHVVCSSI